MIRVNIAGINSKQYKQLMQYILNNCDEISFHLPGVSADGQVLTDPFWQAYHKKISRFCSNALTAVQNKLVPDSIRG